MNAYKKILGLLAAVCLSQTAVAVPATPRPITVRQADGTLLTILLRGDEHGHVAMTTDGKPVCYNEATANYEYAMLSTDGQIAASGLVAKEEAKRTDADHLFLMKQDAQAIFTSVEKHRLERKAQSSLAWGKQQRAQSAKTGGPRRILINDFPAKGSPHTLVILLEFSDTKFTTTGDAYDYYNRMLNEEGFTHSNGANGSSRDFYTASSNGQFSPIFDVVGPITLPKTCSYYGTNYGSDDNYSRIAEMIRYAVTAADDSVDFTKYDYDGDGYIDNIYFFYAGFGEADSYKTNTIWPHSYSWDEFVAYGYASGSLTVDGKKMGSYACSQEINGQRPSMPVGIGTVTHEFGHVIGLPDLYDIYYGTSTFTPGEYDAMDQGSYNNNQNTPPSFSAYERAELGWLDYTELTAGTDTLSVLPDLKDSNKAYIIPVSNTTNKEEFFVLENRQKKGWDKYIPGHGMLMWHIDHDPTAWAQNSVNTVGSHQRVDIVEADNSRTTGSMAGDPFPGTSNVTSWTVKSWAGKEMLKLDDIEETDSTIYIMLGGLNLKLGAPTLSVTSVEDSSLTVEWKQVPMANKYVLNVMQGGEPLDGFTDIIYKETASATLTGLLPDTEYALSLVASRGSYSSDTVSTTVQTKELVFEKYMPTGMKLTAGDGNDPSSVSLVATWDTMDKADDYLVTLKRHSYDAAPDSTSYDFSTRDTGMPEGWTKNGAYISANGMYVKSPSLRLSSSSNHLTMTQPEARIDSLSFWAKGNSTAQGTLIVEACTEGEWKEVASYDITDATSQAAAMHRVAFSPADTVRIRFNRTAGSMYLDNVTTRYRGLQRTPVTGYENVPTGGATTYTFTGLEAGTTYGFTVRGKQGEHLSYTSPEVTARPESGSLGITPAKVQEADGPALFYDLQGRRTDTPRGIVIQKTHGKAVKVAKQ